MSTMTILLLSLILLFGCKPQKQCTTIIEIIGDQNISPDKLIQLCKTEKLEASVYQWKNHLVLYGTFNNLIKIQGEIQKQYPDISINTYKKPFYEFNRQKCEDQTTAKEWDHIIMTANLVEDPVKQQEYMDYHETQFEKWPEVSKGFCNANFQQLLVFRNERQLMLVISIPKGASLDELNPKTTENNPRVDEWNAIMGKYQEGISETEAGESWVLFSNVPIH